MKPTKPRATRETTAARIARLEAEIAMLRAEVATLRLMPMAPAPCPFPHAPPPAPWPNTYPSPLTPYIGDPPGWQRHVTICTSGVAPLTVDGNVSPLTVGLH